LALFNELSLVDHLFELSVRNPTIFIGVSDSNQCLEVFLAKVDLQNCEGAPKLNLIEKAVIIRIESLKTFG
jgi:muramoyltetrapeptide carboxypeptidase LdcA involved in peptidoglycan recycling